MSNKNFVRLATVIGILSWLVFVMTDLYILFGQVNNLRSDIPLLTPKIAFDIFILSMFIYYQKQIDRIEGLNFIDLLWKVFATGLLATVVSLAIKFLFFAFGNTKLAEDTFVINLSYHINVGLIVAFLISTLIVWKKLILYQKSKLLLKSWKAFEYSMVASVLLNLFIPDSSSIVSVIILTLLIIMGLILSVNLKWVAYLNFKQKWKSILLILLVILYLGFFLQNLVLYATNNTLTSNVLDNTFIIALLTFVFVYSFFSLLVILFNLPTSSVFEQKLEEVINFQKLSQSIQTEQSEEQVYDILLQSAVNTVFADAGWIEIFEDEDRSFYHSQNISEKEIETVKKNIKNSKVKGILDTDSDKSLNAGRLSSVLRTTRFKSIIAYPIIVQSHQVGTLALLKEVSEGFNREMTNIIRTFVNQAGISIENFRLLSEAIENERYKEELKIAKMVQKSLLPKELQEDQHFDLAAFSEAADEVGGDYYDTFSVNEHKTALIIGDVSGKGTSAAFHMSQMKGVFTSLAQIGLTPKEFLCNANTVLSASLDRSSFVTCSYFVIDKVNRTLEFARAGHCPTLYFDANQKKSAFFQDKGLGLGILRNAEFGKFLEVRKISYNPNDILILYTDGITEAKNIKREEFGFKRLQDILEKYHNEEPAFIKNQIITSLYDFCGKELLDDDYTMLIVKFK